jgi:hypothetical protein
MRKAFHLSILTRLLRTTALPLALMSAGSVSAYAETVVIVGDNGVAGANGVNPGDPGQPGGDGESVTADAGVSPPNAFPLNSATASGGNGGAGGNGAGGGNGGNGGDGGLATANAATSIVFGTAEADATLTGETAARAAMDHRSPAQEVGPSQRVRLRTSKEARSRVIPPR